MEQGLLRGRNWIEYLDTNGNLVRAEFKEGSIVAGSKLTPDNYLYKYKCGNGLVLDTHKSGPHDGRYKRAKARFEAAVARRRTPARVPAPG
jgi:hypothetical protein